MAPIPVIFCGRSPRLLKEIAALTKPKYEVILGCQTPEIALTEIPALLKGEKLSSWDLDLGVNPNEYEAKAVLMGGAFSAEDCEKIMKSCDAIRPMPYSRADISKHPGGAFGPPTTDILAARAVESLEEIKMKDWTPGLYWF